MINITDPKKGSTWLKENKILLHPTDGVWGLGCGVNKEAIDLLNQLKERQPAKNLIVLLPSIKSINKHVLNLSDEEIIFLNNIWPGHITVLFRANDRADKLIVSEKGKIAIRVSTHYHLNTLLEEFNQPMISTSANKSNQPTPTDIYAIKDTFDHPKVALYDFPLGLENKPSQIIDMNTKEIIRA